jgi:hypothetical protein
VRGAPQLAQNAGAFPATVAFGSRAVAAGRMSEGTGEVEADDTRAPRMRGREGALRSFRAQAAERSLAGPGGQPVRFPP